MNTTTFTIGEDKKTLIVQRTFNAPKTKVWAAYAQPELLARWWGPRGWETRIVHMDFTVGGYWHYGMTCVDPEQPDWFGKTSWGKAKYVAIDPEDSFEYVDYFSDEAGAINEEMPAAPTTITLSEANGATTVVSTTVYATPEELKQLLEMGMEEGFAQTWDRFAEFLEG